MEDVIQRMRMNKFGVHVKNTEMANEILEVAKYYEFYDGKPDSLESLTDDCEYGQVWPIKDNLDYKPTREVRNQIKKLIQKQARFMLGVAPTIGIKPFDKTQADLAEQKRAIIDKVFDDSNFWSLTAKAFLDATIGKRVLLAVIATPGEPISFRYFKMPEFTYTVEPHDYQKLKTVEICYQDGITLGKIDTEQRWHRWKYDMRNGACWCVYDIVDGLGNPTYIEQYEEDEQGNPIGEPQQIMLRQEFNTRFSQIPCRVILNGGLTGDTQGESDVKELLDMAVSYNRTNSDYRDALRFKMFEQPVFIDADSDALANVKIAPNSVIDLKTDPTIGDGTGSGSRSAQATTLASTFNFAAPADSYLDRLKRDMYEIMDQPLPEHLADVPSAKALGFLFFDLKARCEFKWKDWDPVIKWVIELIKEGCVNCNLYPELQAKSVMQTVTNVVITHNYPIPEDEETKKDIAIKEVQANVMSHKTYIRKYGDVEDEDGEWEEIMEELDALNNSSNAGFMETVDEEIEATDGPSQVAGEGMEDDQNGEQEAGTEE